MDTNKYEVANRIKQIRNQHGMTMEEFGKQFETSKNSVHNWENAVNLPNNTRLVNISEFANITLEELLHGNPENKFSVDNHLTKNLYSYVDRKREIIKQEANLLTSAGLEGLFRLIGLGKNMGAEGLEKYEKHRERLNELEQFGKNYIKDNYDNYTYSNFSNDFPNSESDDFQKYKNKQWSIFKGILDKFWEAFDVVNKNDSWISNRFTNQITEELNQISKKAIEEGKEDYYVNELVQPFLDQAAKDFKEYIRENTDIE